MLATCSVPNHYLNQCWIIVNWTTGNRFQWNLENITIFIKENWFQNVACRMSAILSLPQCVIGACELLMGHVHCYWGMWTVNGTCHLASIVGEIDLVSYHQDRFKIRVVYTELIYPRDLSSIISESIIKTFEHKFDPNLCVFDYEIRKLIWGPFN